MWDDKKAREITIDFQASPEIIEHVEMVRSASIDLIGKLRKKNPAIKINKNLVSVGALLHDIGRTKTQGIDHAVVGAQMIRELNKDSDPDIERVALICERHIGGGITKSEAAKIGLPEKDYIPKAIEEKIVSYCDNLVDEENGVSVIRDPSWVAVKYEKKHGKNSEPARMVRELNKFFENMLSA